MNPNIQNPTQQQGNPYDAIVQQFAQRRAGGTTPQATQAPVPQGGGSAVAQVLGGAGAQAQQPVQPGTNTKLLLSALQALNQFASTAGNDPQEVTIIRSLIAILTQLIARDQQRAHQMMGGQPSQTLPQVGGQGPTAGAGMSPQGGGMGAMMGGR